MRKAAVAIFVAVFAMFLAEVVPAGDALAVGAPFEDIGSVIDGGAVSIMYSDGGGLTGVGSQMWNQDSAGIPGQAEESDRFGEVLASGDFNGDGFGDLAIGVCYEGVSDIWGAGLVHVLYADNTGMLSAVGEQWWYQGLNGLAGEPEAADLFGAALTAGDFNGDGFDDLAVGAPGEDLTANSAGAVAVLYGSSLGLTGSQSQFWTQDSPGVAGIAEDMDHFGDSLAAGDFDGNGYDDLAIGIPTEEVDGQDRAGAVCVLYGSGAGLNNAGNDLWTDPWVVIADAKFGMALATGDVDGDGYDDLAIGAPMMVLWASYRAGTVTVLRGSSVGLSLVDHQTIAQGHSILGGYVSDEPEFDDQFGAALAFGDFDGDAFDDLAIAAPMEGIGSISYAGVVHVLMGTASGLSAAEEQFWHQNLSNVWGVSDDNDEFGTALAAGDFDGDGRDDLAVGVPFEDFGGYNSPGVINVFYGGSDGLESGNEGWWQGFGAAGALEDGDWFGLSMTVMRSGMFSDGFESGSCSRWSTVVP